MRFLYILTVKKTSLYTEKEISIFMRDIDISIQKDNYEKVFDILLDSRKWKRTDTVNLYTIRKKIIEYHDKIVDARVIERWIRLILDIQSHPKLNGELVISDTEEKLFVKKENPDVQ